MTARGPSTEAPDTKTDPVTAKHSSALSDGDSASVACYVAGQLRCKELQDASVDQQGNLAVECSSDSGDFSSPVSCPMDDFVGK